MTAARVALVAILVVLFAIGLFLTRDDPWDQH